MRRDADTKRRKCSRYARGLRRPAFDRLAISVVLVTGVVATTAPPASATPTWSVTPSPSPVGPANGSLAGVACVSETSCYAVGSYPAGTTEKTLVEQWNGTSWSIVTSPNPNGATRSSLNGVACPSTTSCHAVGNYFANAGDYTLIERYA